LKEPEFTIPGIDNKLMHLTKTVSSVYRNETEYLIECFAENSENFELVKQLEKTNRNLSNELNLLKQDQKELEHFAYHDYLTGLPNKFMLMKLLEHSIQIAKRSGKLIAVLFLDLDNFKIVNDSMGHSFGDQMMKMSFMKNELFLKILTFKMKILLFMIK
jgi:PleD family two-component response regulator